MRLVPVGVVAVVVGLLLGALGCTGEESGTVTTASEASGAASPEERCRAEGGFSDRTGDAVPDFVCARVSDVRGVVTFNVEVMHLGAGYNVSVLFGTDPAEVTDDVAFVFDKHGRGQWKRYDWYGDEASVRPGAVVRSGDNFTFRFDPTRVTRARELRFRVFVESGVDGDYAPDGSRYELSLDDPPEWWFYRLTSR